MFLIQNNLHVRVVLDTWLNDTIDYAVENFNMHRNDRGLINLDTYRDTKGVGVAIFEHKSLNGLVISSSRVNVIGETKFLITRISDKLTKASIIIAGVYRPQRGMSPENFFEILELVRIGTEGVVVQI